MSYPAADQSDPKNRTVRAELRRPEHPLGLILVLPILGGDYGPSNAFAASLAEAGFATLRFDRKKDIFDPKKDFAHVARSIERGVVDVRRALDWEGIRALAGRGIGVLGISLGSFVATGVAATDRRVGVAILGLSGGNLVDCVYSARSEREIARLFDGLSARGWDAARIRANAHRYLDRLDPLRFAGSLDPRKTLMIQARFDAVVPYENGQALWEAAGRPRRITLFAGHYTAGLFLPYLQQVCARHFAKHLR